MGWRITRWIGLASAAVVAAILAIDGPGELGLRAAIRATARIGAVVFSVTFAASALNSLARARWSKWLLASRRHLGVGFAVVHAMHAALIAALWAGHPASFWATTAMSSVVGGGIGYLWLIAMVATSFDRTARAIGRRAWLALHRSGMYVLWGIFLSSYAGLSLTRPPYAVLALLLVGAYAVRVIAWRRRRGRRSGPPTRGRGTPAG